MASNRISSNESKGKLDNTEESEHSADKNETQLDTSVTQGSDQVQEMYCEECEKHDNKYVPASGFCVDCVEYKCALCIKYHKRHFKNHSLQDQDDMPQDFYLVKCTKHAKELVKFYCFECENLACLECKNSDHKTCSKIRHLPSLVKDVEQSEEFTELQNNLHTLSNDIEKVKTKLEAKANIVFTMEANAKATIKEHKELTINAYNQHQKEVTDEFDEKMEETIAKLKLERAKLLKSLEENQKTLVKNLIHSETDVVKRVEVQRGHFEALKEKALSVTSDLKSLSGDLTQTKASGKKCRLFIEMKDLKQPLEKLKKEILDLQNKDIQYYKIEPVLHKKVSTNILESQTTFFSFKEYEPSELKTAKFYKDVVFRQSIMSITGLCLLSENKLVMTNYSEANLIVLKNLHINTESYDVIKMLSFPWCITKVCDNKAAITFPAEGIVRLITFSDSMSVISTDDIPVGEECHGIAYCNNNLIVSYALFPGKIQILNMSGQVLKCFEKDRNGKYMFHCPEYLTLSADNTAIYVSDNSHIVTSMTLDGQVKVIFRDDKLRGPCQLTVAETGTVFVCGQFSENVHLLSPDLTKGEILLHKSEQLSRPCGIAYCQKNNRLYVGMSNRIKVFKLMYLESTDTAQYN